MNSAWFKKALPHIIAVGIFLLVSVIFCKPALDSSLTLQQSDITQFQGMSHQLLEREKEKGISGLWMPNMFSGMPSYQVTYPTIWSPIVIFHNFFTLYLPHPINFFFLMCISMYFLLLVLKCRPWTAIIGALAFAYCSYTPIALTAGHDTKMFTLAYVPATLAAMILIFDKKYLWGFTLTALFTAMQIGMKHQQVNYYFFIIAAIMSVAYIVSFIKQKQLAHAGKAFSLLIIAAVIGLGFNLLNIWLNVDYTKSSKRGGMLVMDKSTVTNDKITKESKTTGLQKEYAFQWSYGKMESLSLMFPGVMGYGSHYAERDGEQEIFPMLNEKSNVYKVVDEKLNVPTPRFNPENVAMSLSQRIYWGDQPFTVGPVYLGAIICFLGIIGLFLLDGKHKWWLLTATVFGILMALGKNLPGFNYLLFDYLPLYNKFRVPTLTLLIPQVTVPVLAALTLDHIITHQKNDDTWKKIKLGIGATAIVFVFAAGIYFTDGFGAENKGRTKAISEMLQSKASPQEMQAKYNAINDNKNLAPLADNSIFEEQVFRNGLDETEAKSIINALRKDRAAFFGKDIFISLVYVLIAAAFIVLYLKDKLKSSVLIAGVTLAAFIELISFDVKYLNAKNFTSKADAESTEFPTLRADQQILQDKDPNYRVYDMTKGDPFQQSKSSYHHKTIGGYSPAKLGIYDDLITYQLSGTPNPSVINMLNTKYIIQSGQKQGEDIAIPNPGALGNCWLVKGVNFVDGAVAEMKALDNFNPKDTAIIDKSYEAKISKFSGPDSTSYIKQIAFDNDVVQYESNTTAPQLAVFSEIYYKDWNAYIDGKKTDILKANYVLRALMLPAGKHSIEFKLEPQAYINGAKISKFFVWLLIALLIGTIGWEIRKRVRSSSTVKTDG
ncbi:MAG: YfhO family protein [Ferruginibacter sp.]|nr:YfhO family protein [Ferruginibacter sp.]